jgi:leucyl aminopeptidase
LDWLLCGALSRLIIQKKVRGVLGEVALLTSQGKVPADKIFMVGLGPREASSPESLRAAARTAAASAVNAGVARAALDCFPAGAAQSDDALAAVREGLAEGAGTHPIDFTLLAPDAVAFERMSRLVRA